MGPSIPEDSLAFARAVLADYREALATAPVTAPAASPPWECR
jgi:hypothetical protein